jgi:hypothetical protein
MEQLQAERVAHRFVYGEVVWLLPRPHRSIDVSKRGRK